MRPYFKILLVLLIVSCKKESNEFSEAELCRATSFSKEIQPIINANCAIAGCHITGFQQGDLSTFHSVMEKVDAGTFRLRVIDTKSMPPLNPLNENDIKKIICWLDSGAKNN